MKKIEVLDFWAPWCSPCRAMSPSIELLMKEYNTENSGVEIKKVNVDEDSELSVKFGIRSIPTLVFVSDGMEVDRLAGAVKKEKIVEKIKEVQESLSF